MLNMHTVCTKQCNDIRRYRGYVFHSVQSVYLLYLISRPIY